MHEISTELGAGSDLCHPIEKHGRSQWLPGAGQDDGNMQKYLLMRSLREKGQHPVLKVYYFHKS